MMALIAGGLVSVGANGQTPDDTLDLGKVPQKAVRKLIRKDKVKTVADFQHINTACYRDDDSLRYETNLKTYVVNASIGQVWEKYASITPEKAWNGRMVNFGFLFSKPDNQFIYPDNADEPIRVGNVIFVNLRLLRGLKNLGVGFEVTRLDEEQKTICFCYLKDGVSNGSQEIRFIEQPDGRTQVSHLTHYRSHSAFRDKELYPRFHEKLVGEFHENILRQLDGDL